MDVKFLANTAPLTPIQSVTLPNKKYNDGDEVARAKLVDHDEIKNVIRVIKPRGDFYTVLQGQKFIVESIQNHSSEPKSDNITPGTVFSLTDYDDTNSYTKANTVDPPGMLPGSGQILYVENRSMVSRSANQTEDLKISIQF